ncbi:E3 ubiquitin-protein ligase RNF12-A [Symbiodinium microadriaticum]|uniref:E3 ubiquitin-protein ligase RNF12-A n=1 Tax=Symbiodinium microadriaticum TaxID=2951 RepID=A0A1Q9F205_SYMMI|nr:E3 ubiquitin-protein ligase RNF12-A [Symbiodinium microadriaticum]
MWHGRTTVEDSALEVVDSLVLSLGPAEAAPKTSAAERPAAKAKSSQQMKQERARAAAEASQADSQAQLAALRRQRAERYQEQQDTALAYHLSGHDAEAPYDPISALNQSRGAVYSFVTCNMCGTPLRYNSATSAQAVLCPCGNLLQPIHLQGQVFRRRAPSELPVEPGEPVDPNSRPRAVRGPYIQVTGPDGAPSRMPLYSVLQMVRQHGETQQVGADGRTIQALPTRKFAGGEAAAADGTRCEICMEDFAEGDELRTLPCFHLFHSKCIDQWLQVNSICPICRHKVGS